MLSSDPSRLIVTTRRIDPADEPLLATSAQHPLVWSRRGRILIGSGEPVLSVQETGTDRIARLAQRWREVAAAADIDDDVQVPGTGLVGFGALAFNDRSARTSSLTVPPVILGRRGDDAWITTIRRANDPTPTIQSTPFGVQWSATLGPGSLDPAGYEDAVRTGLAAIAAGAVGKVVLARDLAGTAPHDADLRRLVRELASGYPDCWTFAVDGMIGASPETLVTVSQGTVTARVLAGTIARGADNDADNAAAHTLATSHKDQDEHGYAVRSLVASLAPFTSALATSEEPFTLRLPNVWHLATDVEATLAESASSLDLVRALHPTAAVAGTPTHVAMDEIERIEPFDRGRYAGPVGWVDGDGDGEWAIALRCVQADPGAGMIALTAYAGAGIVAGSDPERELLETRVKFRPIVEALA